MSRFYVGALLLAAIALGAQACSSPSDNGGNNSNDSGGSDAVVDGSLPSDAAMTDVDATKPPADASSDLAADTDATNADSIAADVVTPDGSEDAAVDASDSQSADSVRPDTGPDVMAADSDADGTVPDAKLTDSSFDVMGNDGAPDSATDDADGMVGDDAPDGASEGGSGGGSCGSVCAPGFKFCSGSCVSIDDPNYGCSLNACAACLTGPSSSYFAMACVGGACTVASCPAGLKDCDGDPANGCEANLDNPQTCGTCNHVCGSGQYCDNQTCVVSCAFPKTNCSGSCRDVSSDPESCGSCTNACPAAGGTASCSSGSCGFTACTGATCPPTQASCPTNTSLCSGKCADVASDAANCGACGHACGPGQVCNGGICGATTDVQVVTGVSSPGFITVAGGFFYFVADNTVYQGQVGSNGTQLVRMGSANEASPYAIAVGATSVYWSSQLGNAIRTAPIGGGPVTTLYSANKPGPIVVDNDNVYWWSQSDDKIMVAPLTPTDAGTPRVFSQFGATYRVLTSLFIDDKNLYGGAVDNLGGATVIAIGKTTAMISELAYPPGTSFTPPGTAMSPSAILWTVFEGVGRYRLGSVAKPGASAPSFSYLASNGGAGGLPYAAVASDDCSAYWTSQLWPPYPPGSGTPAIVAMSPGGAQPYVLTRSAQQPGAIAIDDSYVYWSDQSWIGRVHR